VHGLESVKAELALTCPRAHPSAGGVDQGNKHAYIQPIDPADCRRTEQPLTETHLPASATGTWAQGM